MFNNRNTALPAEDEPTLVQRGLSWLLARAVLGLLSVVAVLGAIFYAFAVPALLGPVLLVLVWGVSRWLKRTDLNAFSYAGETGIGPWLVSLRDREFSNRVAMVAYEVVRRPLLDVIALIILVFVGIGVAEGQVLTGLSYGLGFAGVVAVVAGRIAVAVLGRRDRRTEGVSG